MSQDSSQRKSILWQDGKLGSNHTFKFSKTTMRHEKIVKRRVHRRESFKNVNLRSEFRALQNSRNERNMNPSGKSGAPAEQPGQRMLINKKKSHKKRFTLLPMFG